MFIETLEFTIPVDLCDLFTTLKDGTRSNMEFPASVNSYGTTQDASIQVALRSNKLTFVVDGVSSNASMISKSECKTLKLSVFDVDRTLIAQECVTTKSMEPPSPVQFPSKRQREFQITHSPRAKTSRSSFSDSPPAHSPTHNSSKPSNDTPVNVKQEPEDPDCIEIEPDPEPDDIVPKKETPYMQIDYSSNVPHTQTSQAALERLSFPPTSRSQSSSSYHQNVPHVQDYSQPGSSHGDQSADDFLVFQDDNDYGDDNDNSADYSNDGVQTSHQYRGFLGFQRGRGHSQFPGYAQEGPQFQRKRTEEHVCQKCGMSFSSYGVKWNHIKAVHENKSFNCACGKVYAYQSSLVHHQKHCEMWLSQKDETPSKDETQSYKMINYQF